MFFHKKLREKGVLSNLGKGFFCVCGYSTEFKKRFTAISYKLQGQEKKIFALRDFRLEKAGKNRKLKRNKPQPFAAYSKN